MKTRTKIIWICLGYLLWGSYAIYTIVQFINGHYGVLDLIVGLVMCVSLIYLLAYNHHRLLKENREKKTQEDESALVVAAECEDMHTAEDLCNKLESNGIKAMIVEKDSPVYIKGNCSPVQIQVCRKDLLEATSTIQQ